MHLIPIFFPTAVEPSAPCWSQPRLVRLAGLTIATWSPWRRGRVRRRASPGRDRRRDAPQGSCAQHRQRLTSNRPNRSCLPLDALLRCRACSIGRATTVVFRSSLPACFASSIASGSARQRRPRAYGMPSAAGNAVRPASNDQREHDADIGKHVMNSVPDVDPEDLQAVRRANAACRRGSAAIRIRYGFQPPTIVIARAMKPCRPSCRPGKSSNRPPQRNPPANPAMPPAIAIAA